MQYVFSTLREKNIFLFDNQFSVSPKFSFNNENTLSFNINAALSTYFSADYHTALLTHQYGGKIQYSYLRKHPGAAAWNCGMVSTLSGNVGFAEKYLGFAALSFNAEARIPLNVHYFYITNTCGYNLISNENIFSLGNKFVSIGSSAPLSYKGGSFSQLIEMKSFSQNYGYTANAFIKNEIGSLITLYRRSHYWKFLTIGFHAIHLRPFAEYALLRNINDIQHLFGTGMEFIADFFVAYGNIPISIVQGNAIGYEIGNPYPIYNGYIAFNVLL